MREWVGGEGACSAVDSAGGCRKSSVKQLDRNAAFFKVMSSLQWRVEPWQREHLKTDYSLTMKATTCASVGVGGATHLTNGQRSQTIGQDCVFLNQKYPSHSKGRGRKPVW